MSEDGESENFKKMKCAIINDDVISICDYLKSGFDVNETDEYGQTYLMFACDYTYQDIVLLLIDYGANVNIKNNMNRNALFYISDHDYVSIQKMSLLLINGINIISSENIFFYLYEKSHIQSVKFLIEYPDIPVNVKIDLLEDALKKIQFNKSNCSYSKERCNENIKNLIQNGIQTLKNGLAIEVIDKHQNDILEIKNFNPERKNQIFEYFKEKDVKINEIQTKIDELQSKIDKVQNEKYKFFKSMYM